jgi:hypothetical protein
MTGVRSVLCDGILRTPAPVIPRPTPSLRCPEKSYAGSAYLVASATITLLPEVGYRVIAGRRPRPLSMTASAPRVSDILCKCEP